MFDWNLRSNYDNTSLGTISLDERPAFIVIRRTSGSLNMTYYHF